MALEEGKESELGTENGSEASDQHTHSHQQTTICLSRPLTVIEYMIAVSKTLCLVEKSWCQDDIFNAFNAPLEWFVSIENW